MTGRFPCLPRSPLRAFFHPAIAGGRRLLRPAGLGALLAIVCLLPRLTGGAEYESWSQVENAGETRDYGDAVRAGRFEAAERAFLDQVLLPQLELEANRDAITDVRRELPELALRGARDAAIIEAVNTQIRDFATGRAADPEAAALVRVNAMLLVGELEGPDRKPWPGSVSDLARVAGDAGLPLAVRIAALAGLERHADEGQVDDAFRQAVEPVAAGIISSPPEGDPAAVTWLRSRAVDLLAAVRAPPPVLKTVSEILADAEAAIDLRVRSARTLGRLATPEAGLDGPGLVTEVRKLAGLVLSREWAAAKQRRFARRISEPGGMMAGMAFGEGGFRGGPGFDGMRPPGPPGYPPEGGFMMTPDQRFGDGSETGGVAPPNPLTLDEDTIGPLACRRDAWRLYVLAEAIKPKTAAGGLAGLIDDADAAAKAAIAADELRQLAADLDEDPTEAVLVEALKQIGPAVGVPVPSDDLDPFGDRPPGRRPASPFDRGPF